MRKRILFIIGSCLLLAGCDKVFPTNFHAFSGGFMGIFKAEYYKSKNGETVYLDSANTFILSIPREINEIKLMQGDSVLESLVNIITPTNRKMQRNDQVIKYGEDPSGNKKSIRMTMLRDTTGRNAYIFTSNFIKGEYDASKDTVDIYYTRIFED